MDEVNAMSIHEIRKATGAADTSDTDDLFMRILELFQHLVEGG